MANTTEVAEKVARIPSREQLERVEKFTREPFAPDPDALRPGTARRRAFDAALAEIEAGREEPSVEWRQQYSLMLGLERLLADDEPKLVDGTVLSAHQVDALSGTLTALIAEAERQNGNGAARARGRRARGRGATTRTRTRRRRRRGRRGRRRGRGRRAAEDEDDERPRRTGAASSDGRRRSSCPSSRRTRARPGASGSSTRPAPARPSRRSASSRARAPAATLILTHRRNLVDQFLGELRDRGYSNRISPPLLRDQDRADGPVTVETYQWFVRNAGNISDAYTIVICDEAHTALGEKTSASIRNWQGPVFIGMTATGALIARHVTDLFPTQTSRFDLAQAARRGVIAPLRCVRIPPGPQVRTLAKVPLRKGEVDQDFDQEELAALLDQGPFNAAVADLYRVRFKHLPGIVYSAGVKHAQNVANAFKAAGMKAEAVSGETPKRELARILAAFERGEIDVLVNAMLLAEGWNSPRATVCMHLAPTASRRVYQQRVGRVTRRHPGKEAGIVVDFVHPATTHDEPIVTLHKLLDRDVYRGGAIVVGPVRRGRGRRLRVERRIVPVTSDPERRLRVFERELWRIAVEYLLPDEQHAWAALAGARVAPNGWRRAKATLHHDANGELRRRFLLELRPAQPQRRSCASARWPRSPRAATPRASTRRSRSSAAGRARSAARARAPCFRRWPSAASAAATRRRRGCGAWPSTRATSTRSTRCSAGRRPSGCWGCWSTPPGAAHGRNARRLVHAARKHDRRLAAALLAAALGAHARGRGGPARRAQPHGAQALGARARAGAELPEGQAPPQDAARRPLPTAAGGARRRTGSRGDTDLDPKRDSPDPASCSPERRQ